VGSAEDFADEALEFLKKPKSGFIPPAKSKIAMYHITLLF